MKTRVSIKYFESSCKLNDNFSRNNLPRIKYGVYVINFNDKNSKGIIICQSTKVQLCILVLSQLNTKQGTQEVLNKIKDKTITRNIIRIQDNKSIMCGFYCIAFIEYMLSQKALLDTNLLSPNDYKKMTK